MDRKCRALLVFLGMAAPGMVFGLGLGEMSLQSYLNEPLRAEVDLLESAGLNAEQVKIRLATREDFERSGIERAYFLTSLKFEVILEPGKDGRLVITSPQPVREPFLDFILEARWPNGRLLREYTVLLDPPVFSGTRSAETSTASMIEPAQAAESAPADVMPARSERPASRTYDADAEDQPSVGGKYLVQRNETLWAIASRARPAGASLQQTMLDIKRLNPEAFIGGNINGLKAGYVLRLPTSSDISNDDLNDAVAAIATEDQRWEAARRGERLDAREDAGSSGVVPDDEEGGRLQIAGEDEAPAGGRFGDLEEEVTATLENLDRTQRDNADMQARVSSMEDQIQTMRRLMELKDDQIAALQQSLSEDGSSDATSGTLDSGTLDSATAVEDEASVDDGTVVADSDTSVEPATPVEEPAPAPAPVPVVEQDKGFFGMVMDNLLYAVLAFVLLLGLVIFVIRGRLFGKDDEEETLFGAADRDDDFADVELGDDGLIVDQFQDRDGDSDSIGDESMQNFATEEDVYAAQFESGDALAEADIYIAYGRYPQAVDVLKSAIAVEPINTELRLKLMEACAEMAEREEFQQQYADLQLIGDDAALASARDYLEIVDGGEMWLQDLPNPSLSMAEVDAARERMGISAAPAAAAAAVITDTEAWTDDEIDVAEVDAAVDEDIADVVDDGAQTDASLDLDLSSDVEPEAVVVDGDKMDLDLDLELEEPAASSAPEPLQQVGLDNSAEISLDDLDADGDALDLELDPLPEGAGATFDGPDEPELELADELDGELLTEFGDLTIDDGGALNISRGGDGDLTFDDLDAEQEDDELVFASNGDEAATKLDLARAYIDMGDQEGARSILQEVLQDAEGAHKQDAQSLLDSID